MFEWIWDPSFQVSDTARGLIDQRQLKLDYGNKDPEAVIRPAKPGQNETPDFKGSEKKNESQISAEPPFAADQAAQPAQDDTEKNRAARRNGLKKKIEELTGRPYAESLDIIKEINQINSMGNMGLFGKPEIYDPRQDELNKLIDETPAELFIPTEEEWAENLKQGRYAFAAGVGNGITSGLDELFDRGGEITPEQAKDLAKKGVDLLFARYKDGKYYVPSKKEINEIMEKENPIVYSMGNLAGGLPYDIVTAGAAASASEAVKPLIKIAGDVAPGLIEDAVSAIQAKKDLPAAVTDMAGNALFNAAGGIVSDKTAQGLEKILKKSPDVLKKTLPELFGTGFGEMVKTGGQTGLDYLMGEKPDYNEYFRKLPFELFKALLIREKD